MNVRNIGIAVAVVLAMACRTSGGSQTSGATGSAPAEPQPSSGATASGQGQAGQDPLMQPGPAIKGHASDRIVSGSIDRVSSASVEILSDRGEHLALDIVPETSITVDGSEATQLELKEGQPVRASFNEVGGREVAVEIKVRSLASGSGAPSPGGIPAPSTPDASGSMGTGATPESGQGGTGTPAYPPDAGGSQSPGSSTYPPEAGGSPSR